MNWFTQWAATISGESAENMRRREEARDALDRYDAQQRAIRESNENEARRAQTAGLDVK